jgi:hypothetical protein
MQCVAYPSDNWITCTGGKNTRVYLFSYFDLKKSAC